MKTLPFVVLATAALATAIAGGFLAGRRPSDMSMPPAQEATGKKILYWYDPMIPDQHFPKAGLSPMGMDMVPRYADDGDGGATGVRIDPSVRQNLGLRTAPVVKRRLVDRIDVPATVAWDLSETTIVSARADGVVDHLFTPAPSTMVSAGQPLATLISPAWNSALAENEALRHVHSSDARELAGASRERLAALGLDSSTRAGGGHGGATLIAPRAGELATVDVREGQRVVAGQTLMTIAGTDHVWVEASVPQASAARVTSGMPVTVRVDGIAQPYAATIGTMVAALDTDTRTRRARIVLADPQHRLAPGMFAHVVIEATAPDEHPLVPDEALIETGEQARVVVDDGNGRFHPQEVRTGSASGGYTEIVEGLQGDERVVVSGQFLLDSEASLSGSLRRLDATPAPVKEASP